jgi:hypothetical protein
MTGLKPLFILCLKYEKVISLVNLHSIRSDIHGIVGHIRSRYDVQKLSDERKLMTHDEKLSTWGTRRKVTVAHSTHGREAEVKGIYESVQSTLTEAETTKSLVPYEVN